MQIARAIIDEDYFAHSQTPFVLSLSKHRFVFNVGKKGRPFDKLRANGSW
jgi:hypothetical protein